MSVKLKANIAAALALCAVLFCSCGTKEELFDSYDSCFVSIPEESGDFVLTRATEHLLLRDTSYEVSLTNKDRDGGKVLNTTLALSCPVECDKYDWKITRAQTTDNNTPLSDNSKNGSNGKGTYEWFSRNISVYISMLSNSVFYTDAVESGQSCYYRIHLWVNVGEEEFYDSALLAVRMEF